MNTRVNMRVFATACLCSVLLSGCASAPSSSPVADHLSLFAPPPMHPVSASRSADGRPGPGYWQQRADFVVAADLDLVDRRVSAYATLTYTNNAPLALPFIWFELPLDALRDTSRSSVIRHVNTRFKASGPGMGFQSLVFTVDGEQIKPTISDTRAMVPLPTPVAANGGQVEIQLAWSFKVPEGSNRLGVLEFDDDDLFELGRWIPQPCVYDDLYGWNTLPYLGAGESYSDFGDYDITITAPEGITVLGGGEWVNPEQRLTAKQLNRYNISLTSAEPVWIITPEEAILASQDTSTLEPDASKAAWRFIAKNVRTFAFIAGRSYAMDGAGVYIGESRVRCLSVFPPKVSELWHEVSTPAIQHALSFYSEFLGLDYPYPVMINGFGVEGGTEYPMMVFSGTRQPEPPEKPADDAIPTIGEDGKEISPQEVYQTQLDAYQSAFDRAKDGLFSVTDHEVLHSWFPMVVGNDERRDGWLDEGFNEYGNPYSLVAWKQTHNDPQDDSSNDESAEQTHDALSVVRKVSEYAFDRPVPTILTWADRSQAFRARGLNVYYKPAAGLITLREGILGPERFDFALKTYLNAWAFKHPRPGDFFRCIENAAGEDLGWFWRGWFGSTDTMDLAVRSVKRVEPEGMNAEPYWAITLKMIGQIPAPVTLRIEFDTGEQVTRKVPVEAWFGGREFTLRLDEPDRTPFSVLLDPQRVLPDADRSNNRWLGSGS